MKIYDRVSKERLEQYEEEFADKIYQSLQSAVKLFKHPSTFDLDRGVRDRHIPRIIELINSNPSIDNLFCDGCNIGNHGIKLMAEGLKYVKQLSVDSTDIGRENPDKTADTIIALAHSNIKTLIISRTTLKNADIDLLIAHSRQTKIILGNNRYIDDSLKDKAISKARENSEKLLKSTFLGSTPSKRLKSVSDTEQTSPYESPEDESLGKKKI